MAESYCTQIITLSSDKKNNVQILEGTYKKVTLLIKAGSILHIEDRIQAISKEIIVEPGAHCLFYYWYTDNDQYTTIDHTFYVNRAATAQIFCGGETSQECLQKIDLNLCENDASAIFFSMWKMQKKGSVTLQSTQHHKAPHTTSYLAIRKTIQDSASFIFKGLVHITKSAVSSNAIQQDRTLLLSSTARAESIPALEVLTNDVQCAHGSAIGTLSQEQLWYLQTRGLSLKISETMLYNAFFAEGIQKMTDHFMQNYATMHLFKAIE